MKTRLFMIVAAGGLVVVSACARQESAREIDWAKSALARNPAYEIVATDESAGVFTVRDTATGVMQTLRLEDLVAAPLPAKPVATPEPEAMPADLAAAVETPTVPDDAPSTEIIEVERAGSGATLVEGPGYSITRGDAADQQKTQATLEGPGYSVSRGAIARNESTQRENEPASERTASNVERRTDPIVCQGNRLMRIDGETIEFTGDAVIAEKGCDLYISNARISAGGVGIIVRQARVHIVNSSIGGTRGSYEASQGAEIYVARSTFTGVGRRFDSATMTDLGNNTYLSN
jgi:hypothetical protein